MALGSGSLLHMLHFRHSKIIEQIDFGLPSHVSWSRVYVLSLSFQIVLESVNSTRKHWDRMWQELHHEAWFSHLTPVSTKLGEMRIRLEKAAVLRPFDREEAEDRETDEGLGTLLWTPQLLRAEQGIQPGAATPNTSVRPLLSSLSCGSPFATSPS